MGFFASLYAIIWCFHSLQWPFCWMSWAYFKCAICRNNDELRKDAVDALCCLAHALGEDFIIFIPSIRKLLLKHRLRVFFHLLVYLFIFYLFDNIFLLDGNKPSLLQHRDFDEIESRLLRREPLILENASVQKFTRRVSVEVVSDPVNDVDAYPYDEGIEMHSQLRSHQVIPFFLHMLALFICITDFCCRIQCYIYDYKSE